MQALRLLAVDALDARIAYYRSATVQRRAVRGARGARWRAALPRAAHVINLSENRYHFLLGWVAACLREQVTLLPSGRTDDVLARLRHQYPDHHTIDDESIERLLSQGRLRRVSETLPAHWQLPADRIVRDRVHFRFDGRFHAASENLGQPVSQFARSRRLKCWAARIARWFPRFHRSTCTAWKRRC